MQIKTEEEKDKFIIMYIKEKVRLRKNIGNDLISLFDKRDFIENIHSEAQEELFKVLNNDASFNSIDKETIFISLVIIGLEFYDGNYYEHVEDIYTKLYNDFKKQKIDGIIRSIIKEFMPKSEDYSRMITFALENAIAPKWYLNGFFEFMYDIYKINFQYSLDEQSLDEELDFIFDGLKESFLTDDDDINIKVTNKTYKLIKSTKNLITRADSVLALKIFSKKVLKLIDEYYWHNQTEIENEYFNYGLNSWREKFEKIKNGERAEFKKRNLYFKWKPDFELHGNNIYLTIPQHNIKSEYDYRKIGVCIFENGKFVKEIKDYKVYDVFGGYKIVVDNVLIDHPFSNIQYKIFIDDKILYDSRDFLYRNYLIFNENGREIVPDNKYKGNLFIAYKRGESIDNEIIQYYENGCYCLGNTFFDGQRIIIIGNELINVLNKTNYQVLGQKYEKTFIKYNGKNCDVFKNVSLILFESLLNENEIGVSINNCRKKLYEEQYVKKQREGSNLFIFACNIDRPGYYVVEFFEISTGKTIKNAQFRFFVDPTLQYELEKLDDSTYYLLMESSLSIDNEEYEIDIKKFDEFHIDVVANGIIGHYEIPLDIPIFRIDDMCWQSIEEYIWIDDVTLSSNLVMKYLDCDEIIITHEGKFLSKIIPSKKDEIIIVNVASLNNYKMTYDYIDIYINYKGNKENQIRCYNKAIIAEDYPQIIYNPGTMTLQISLYYFGKSKLNLYVSTVNDSRQECISIEKNKFAVELLDFPSNIETIISIVEEQNGFSLQSSRELYHAKRKFWAYKDLEKKYVNVESVNFEIYTKNYSEFKTFYIKRTFFELKKYLGEKKYIGELYTMEKGIKKVFKNVNPLEIEFVGEIKDNMVEAIATYERDGLLIDFNSKTLYDDITNPKAQDAFSYNLYIGGDRNVKDESNRAI